MANMTIRQAIWLAVALVALFVGGQNAFLAVEVKKLSGEVVLLARRHEPMLLAAKDMEIAIIQVQQWLQDISATRALDGLNDGFEKAEHSAQEVYQKVEELSRLDSNRANEYKALLPLFADYYRVGKEMAELYIDQGPEVGNTMMPRFDAASEALQKQVNVLVDEIEQLTQRVGTGAEAEVGKLITLLWVLFGLLLLLVLCLVVLLQSKVLHPIRHINELAKDIAHGNGDLTKRVNIQGRSELAEVALWFNSFIDKIHQLVSQVKNSVNELDREALSLQQVTELTNKNIVQQNQQTNQASVAVSQMASTVTEVAQNAAIAADAAISADEETQKGTDAVSLTEQAIHNLAREIESAATVICSLESDSEKIGGVLDVIRGIAEQTNLLALNAAIEAARAGEQGRGFAVVADEVRNLASRTQESTEEIHSMIESLQRASEKAVSVMQDSQKRAAESVEKANTAGASLQSIANTIARISDMNTQIATAAEEQSAMAVEIDNNIAAIKNVGGKTSDDAQKIEISGRRLNEVAGDLKRLVAQYRV